MPAFITFRRPPETGHPLRRAGIVFGAGLLLALAIGALDRTLSDLARELWRTPSAQALKPVMKAVQLLGKTEVQALLALTLGACGFKRQATAMLLALLLTAGMVWPLKLAVHRERPNQGSHHSFPSGDAASAAAAAWPLQRIHPLALPAAATAVCGVAAGRVLTGAHYPSDVLAGAAIGALAGGLAFAALRRARLRLSWRHFAAAAAALAVAGVLAGTLKPRGDLERMASVMIFLGPPAALAVALRVVRVWRRRRRRS